MWTNNEQIFYFIFSFLSNEDEADYNDSFVTKTNLI
jgi:hypothetical protein